MIGRCQQSTDDVAVKSNGLKVDPAKLLNVVLSMLPLHAEEGRQRDSLLEVDLVSALIDLGGATEGSSSIDGLHAPTTI